MTSIQFSLSKNIIEIHLKLNYEDSEK